MQLLNFFKCHLAWKFVIVFLYYVMYIFSKRVEVPLCMVEKCPFEFIPSHWKFLSFKKSIPKSSLLIRSSGNTKNSLAEAIKLQNKFGCVLKLFKQLPSSKVLLNISQRAKTPWKSNLMYCFFPVHIFFLLTHEKCCACLHLSGKGHYPRIYKCKTKSCSIYIHSEAYVAYAPILQT